MKKFNKINNLQNQDIPKDTIIADTFKKCDANCDAFWKNSQLFSPKFHIWLRKNVDVLFLNFNPKTKFSFLTLSYRDSTPF